MAIVSSPQIMLRQVTLCIPALSKFYHLLACLLTSLRRSSSDQSITLPACCYALVTAADVDRKAAVVDGIGGRTDGRTDTRPLHRPCSAYYAGSAKGRRNCNNCLRNIYQRTAKIASWTTRTEKKKLTSSNSGIQIIQFLTATSIIA